MTKEESYRKLIQITEEIHIKFVITHQEGGGWGEEIKDIGKNVPSPLVTSQMVIGLLPYLEIERCRVLKKNITESIRNGIQFIVDRYRVPGWSDHSGEHIIVDATGAAVTAIINSIPYELVATAELQEYICNAIKFLVEQQNPEDGGWSVVKGGESKIQYTYWALKALHAYDKFGQKPITFDIKKVISLGLEWLKKNFKAKHEKGFSITINGDMGAIASALGIELFGDFSIDYDKKRVFDYYESSQTKPGGWDTQTDITIVGGIPRRVYVLNDIPRILECIAILDIEFNSEIFVNVLNNIKKLENSSGGFKQQESDSYSIGWFTAEVLKMLSTLINKYNSKIENHVEDKVIAPIFKKHLFSKGILMIGRFRPPHLGHYNGLRAILNCDKNEFLFPEKVIKELVHVDKIFIGIARYEISKENPFTTGEVRDIWRQIVDNDQELTKKSNMIEITTCPADKNLNNVINAIDELTHNRNSIIVISGNERILDQCKKNSIKYFGFKRQNTEISGSTIRSIISGVDFDNLVNSTELLENLKKKLHPVAFEFMMNEGLFKKAKKLINSK